MPADVLGNAYLFIYSNLRAREHNLQLTNWNQGYA